MNRQRTGKKVTDDHIAWEVPPLVERSPQIAFLVPRPGMLGLERQLIIHVHFVPAYFIDPDHRAFRLQIVQLLPQSSLFLVDWQRRNLGKLRGQQAENVDILRGKIDLFGNWRRFVMTGIVQHLFAPIA